MKRFFTGTYLLLLAAIIVFSYCNGFGKNDIIKINYEQHGCFGSERSELTLHKKDGDTLGKFKMSGKNSEERLLNSKQIKAVYDFVERVKNLKDEGGCTSVSYYIIYTKGGMMKKVDEGCTEKGYPDIKMVLFNHY